ncbi:MAG: MltA domain-containing protein [Deltaproteobacteria bacterium]|nr:MltA domain-containing protein [Deltaproteobacteria bacterium]
MTGLNTGLYGVFVVFLLVAFLPASEGYAQAREGDSFLVRDDMDRESLRQAIGRSLEFLAKLPADRPVGEQPRKFTALEIRESLVSFLRLLDLWEQPEQLAEEIRSRFELHPMAGEAGASEILVTGYYQPVIEGSLTETAEYRFPIYGRPKDLIIAEMVTLIPRFRAEKTVERMDGDSLTAYFSRHEIDGLGRLRGKGYEIAWAKDPVDLFFLHIQGSGLIRLADGRRLQLGYAASNGRPYTSIGMLLVDSGKLSEEEVSMQRLRRYLAEHPEERDALLAQNERYVFFRLVKDGPLGSLGVPLTAGRSIATDARLFPKGALAFITARKPLVDSKGNLAGWQPFSRFVLNQDTGSAIQGPRRVDVYFGAGREAGQAAGFMKSRGTVRFLVPKQGAGK